MPAPPPRRTRTGWASPRLYAQLFRLTGSPVVQLNRAVAVGRAVGPALGLSIADSLSDVRSLRTYALLPAVRGDLLAQLGRRTEAAEEFRRAAELTANARERAGFRQRAAELS